MVRFFSKMSLVRLKLWMYLSVLFISVFTKTQVTSGQLQSQSYKNLCESGIRNWRNKDMCKYIVPQTSRVSRFPYRIWEGNGHFRFLGRKNIELSCDFQQPRSIISNIIWYKINGPRSPSYGEDEKRVIYRPINNGGLFHPYNYKIYALGRPGGSSLFIQDVSLRDVGVYRCLASRYAIPSFSHYPEIFTVYKDVEFYPKYIDYDVFE